MEQNCVKGIALNKTKIRSALQSWNGLLCMYTDMCIYIFQLHLARKKETNASVGKYIHVNIIYSDVAAILWLLYLHRSTQAVHIIANVVRDVLSIEQYLPQATDSHDITEISW